MDYTEEQKKAIEEREKNILVSAGAGAGKTRVLVSRMSSMILDAGSPVSADEFLVLTFTNAAAKEMKERIITDLEKQLKEQEDSRYLKEQIRRIKHADISTVHSFCNHLIRTHFNEIGIDPSFRIGEEGELFLLKKQAMDALLEERYSEGTEQFLNLVEAYAPGREDRVLEEMIGDMYRFSRSFPDASGWFQRVEKMYQDMMSKDGMEHSKPIQLLMEKAQKVWKYAEDLLVYGESLLVDQKPPRIYDVIQNELVIVRKLKQQHTFEQLCEIGKEISFPSFPKANKEEKAFYYTEKLKGIHNTVKDEVTDLLSNAFFKGSVQVCIDHGKTYSYLKELFFLTEQYENKYMTLKQEKNVFDFDDLEHFALKLLVEEYKEDGEAVPSVYAKEIAAKYKAIFVDEYQDTNLVQETILMMLMQSGKATLFTVGDVKQSIYRFRQARPDLFLKRYAQYEKTGGLNIELRDNFRSSPDVLNFCNQVFFRWMKKEFGGVEYTDKIMLRAGDNGPMKKVECTQEALLIKKEKDASEAEIDDLTAETVLIAERIKQLHEEGYAYKDMVILLRSANQKAQFIADYLNAQKIPAVCESETGYFLSREIQLMMNYLAIVDNVYQDIPMASVLLSSIGGLTQEELAMLKILVPMEDRRNYSLYDLLCKYLVEGSSEELKEKIQTFMETLEGFRTKKQEVSLNELLWDIYLKTGFYYDVLSMPNGDRRRDNLYMLLQKAEEYEKTIYKGLFYFIRYMEQMRTYEIEIGAASGTDQGEDIVKIMTIHKSKGLEFPVVFVSTLSKGFNKRDLNKSILYHPELGVGMDVIDLKERTKSPSVLKSIIKKECEKELLEEELRILYVAMTRAQKKLILTGVVKQDYYDEVKKDPDQDKLPESASCFMDWILPIVFKFENENNDKIIITEKSLSDIEKILQSSVENDSENKLTKLLEIVMEEDSDTGMVREGFNTVYPYQEAICWKRKYSVSELKKQSMIALPLEREENYWTPDEKEEEILKPEFMKETHSEEMEATAKGTMIHKMMELLPFDKIHDKKELFEELNHIMAIDATIKESIVKQCFHGIESFLFSDYGKIFRRLESEKHFYKELPFTIAIPVQMLHPESKVEDSVIIQGIIDACGEEEDGLWLIDYKTDRIKEGEESILLDRYRSQMLYYKIALEKMKNKTVKHSLIYSFALQKFVEVD